MQRSTWSKLLVLLICGSACELAAQVRDPRMAQREPDSTQTPNSARATASGAPVRATEDPNKAAPYVPPRPQVPFRLTQAEEKALDEVLNKWEQRNEKIKTYKCRFTRWDYDPAFGPKQHNFLKAEGHGEIKYKAPDHGSYHMLDMQESTKDGKYEEKKEGLEHWVCDGESIFEFAPREKHLIQHKLPPEMRGKAIIDGPLPFVFGAKAEQLKKRYFLRDITPKTSAGKEVWLEAYPRYQRDAANFQRVELILTEKDFLPYALQLYLPGTQRTVYQFEQASVNSLFGAVDFMAPRVPFGWQKVVEEAPRPESEKQPKPGEKVEQARRNLIPFMRK